MSLLMLLLAMVNVVFMLVNLAIGEGKMAFGCFVTAVFTALIGLAGITAN